MAEVRYIPAGYYDSEDEDFDQLEGYYFEKSEKNHIVPKTKLQEFTENLLIHLKSNNVSDLRALLNKGMKPAFNIDSAIDGQWNLVYLACSLALPDVLLFLIKERRVYLDTRIEGETPLMVACSSRQKSEEILKVVKILAKFEPKLLNRTNYLGENSLMLAAREGHLCVMEYLINIGESYDTINNSGRNVLFYAIEGKHIDVAKKLFEMKIDLDIKDCTGMTAKKYAEEYNATEILELFPPEEYKYQTPPTYFTYNSIDTIIPDTFGENSIPSYFPDIVCMLRGMDCEKFITLFSKANISLEQFLTIDEKGLEEIGIEFSYQRKTILFGLHNFFKAKWTNKSIYLPENAKSNISPVDLVYIMANILRQTIVLKSQLIYLQRLKSDYGINYPFENLSMEHFKKFQNHIKEMKRVMEKAKVTKRPLLIERQSQSIECNALKRSQIYKFTQKALKIILPLAIMSVITFKVFLRK